MVRSSCKNEDFSSEERQTYRIKIPCFKCWIEDGQGVLGSAGEKLTYPLAKGLTAPMQALGVREKN